MMRIVQRIGSYLLFGVSLTTSASSITGCEYIPESTFKLASESRLPKWITLPSGITRSDVSITMSYYDRLWGNNAKFTLQDTKKKILAEEYGKVKCKEPFKLKSPPQEFASSYPTYEAIAVNGMTEIVEHRKMEPIFYITDDATVWKQYSEIGCR